MSINKLKNPQVLIFLALLTIIGCNRTDQNDQNVTVEEKESALIDSSKAVQEKSSLNDQTVIDTL